MDLTLKQLKFIDAYLGSCNGNAKRAAIEAGYPEKTAQQQGSENLSKPVIKAEISRRYRESCMDEEEVLRRLGDQARGVGAYIDTSISEAKPHVRVKQLIDAGLGHLIKSVKYTDKGACNLEFYDAQAALIHIGRHLKLFTDKTEHSGEVGVRNLSDIPDHELDKLLTEGAEGGANPPTVEG